ncbi:hypothetical protein [Thermococcus sp. 2319x1]
MIAFGTMNEDEVKEFEKEMKEVEEWFNSQTPAS